MWSQPEAPGADDMHLFRTSSLIQNEKEIFQFDYQGDGILNSSGQSQKSRQKGAEKDNINRTNQGSHQENRALTLFLFDKMPSSLPCNNTKQMPTLYNALKVNKFELCQTLTKNSKIELSIEKDALQFKFMSSRCCLLSSKITSFLVTLNLPSVYS